MPCIDRAYIHKLNKEIANKDGFTAWIALQEKVIETEFYTWEELCSGLLPLSRSTLLIGGKQSVRMALNQIGVAPPDCPQFHDVLQLYLKRRVEVSCLKELRQQSARWTLKSPFFVKPLKVAKAFPAHVFTRESSLSITSQLDEHFEILISEYLDFISEWRYFVIEGEIRGVSHYAGRWDIFPSETVVKKAVQDFAKHSPVSYAIDFGVTINGESALIEVNDAYSLSSYGLSHSIYLELLMKRWKQIVSI